MRTRLAQIFLFVLAFLLIHSCSTDQEQTPSPKAAQSSDLNRATMEQEYRLVQTELQLARSGKAYLVIDFEKNEMRLKLEGAVVWNYRLEISEEDSAAVSDFLEHFRGDRDLLLRSVTRKYLFSAQEMNPDSVLDVVADVLNVQPELLQRDIPERFLILWGNELTMDVYTNADGKPRSVIKNAIIEVAHALNRPLGESVITVRMQPEAAVTFYHAVTVGTPTLIYPPSGQNSAKETSEKEAKIVRQP
jgi:hypothetical protein